ncbi:MAG: B12-binding domain-containing radical SAM protein [Geobacteraceae bacterium]|nr:B12-binding domain-containing radical SAM protein [Geobacteraceae bacterium]
MIDILFVQNYYEQMLGIMQISAVLKQHGYSTAVSIGSDQKVIRDVLDKQPRIVGFYSTTGFHHKNLALAAQIKQKADYDLLILFGGPHPTFVPEVINSEGVDVICCGEGEYAVLELVQALRSGTDYSLIHNLTVKSNGRIIKNPLRPLCDLDQLPFPDRELYMDYDHIFNSKRQEVMLGRGCPFSCNFCSAAAYRELYQGVGRYVRLRSIDHVLLELANIRKQHNPSCFFFHDDTFTAGSTYCNEFLERYKQEIGLPFSCLLRADLVSDDFIGRLKDAGCYLVAFGVESGNQEMRATVLNKNITDEKLVWCAELLHRHNIPFATFNMVGLPGETLNQVWETIELNVRLKPLWVWLSIYQTLPDTLLARYALENGYIQSVDVTPADATFHEQSIILRQHHDGREIIRLKCCANIVVKFPSLRGFVARVCRSSSLDKLLAFIEKSMYFTFYYRRLTYNMNFLEAVKSAFFIFRRLKEFS